MTLVVGRDTQVEDDAELFPLDYATSASVTVTTVRTGGQDQHEAHRGAHGYLPVGTKIVESQQSPHGVFIAIASPTKRWWRRLPHDDSSCRYYVADFVADDNEDVRTTFEDQVSTRERKEVSDRQSGGVLVVHRERTTLLRKRVSLSLPDLPRRPIRPVHERSVVFLGNE
jgi:hypothetical protein